MAPYMMNGGTDSRHFQAICPYVYKFSPFCQTAAMRATVHSADERIPLEEIGHLLAFYSALLNDL